MNRIKKVIKTKTGKAGVAIVFVLVLYATAHSTAVSVVNYPSLMSMVQRMVTQVITNKIQEVWNKEVKVKLEPGIINTSGITIPGINMESWTEKVVGDYVGKVGGFIGKDNKFYMDIAKREAALAFPAASETVSDFQKKTREISILIAGGPTGTTDLGKYFKERVDAFIKAGKSKVEAELQAATELAGIKRRVLMQQASVSSFEKASEGIYMAEKAKKELAAIKPSSFDGIKSDQAVKDLAKIMYYNTMLQAQTLSVMSNGEMSHALSSNN